MAGLLPFTVQFTLQAKTAQIDALVTFFITFGVYGFVRFLLCGGGWRWYWLPAGSPPGSASSLRVGLLALLILIPAVDPQGEDPGRLALGYWRGRSSWCWPSLSGWCPCCSPWPRAGSCAAGLPGTNILLRQTVTRYANAWHHVKTLLVLPHLGDPAILAAALCCCPGWWWPGARPSRAGQAHHIAARLPGAGDPSSRPRRASAASMSRWGRRRWPC